MKTYLKVLVARLPSADEQYQGLLELHKELLEEPKRL